MIKNISFRVKIALVLNLNDYQSAIALGESFALEPLAVRQHYPDLVTDLLDYFGVESGRSVPKPADLLEQRQLLKALLTVRPPNAIEDDRWQQLDQLFRLERLDREIVDPGSLAVVAEQTPSSGYSHADSTVLWQGDISLLAADVITNAANSDMLGCFQPFHACIDNVIHSYAGPRLRDDCGKIMRMQGHPEETSQVKLTRAYHLPSRFVAHTVGPIVGGREPDERQQRQLADCYRNTLSVCTQWGHIRSVAFCCISTGVFGYPQEGAAKVAIKAVEQWRSENPDSCVDSVIFNVFRDDDLQIYRRLFETC